MLALVRKQVGRNGWAVMVAWRPMRAGAAFMRPRDVDAA